MFVRIDDFEIEYKFLDYVAVTVATVSFEGKALEEKGLKIHKQLKQYKKDDIVEFDVETRDYYRLAGIAKVMDINLEIEGEHAPLIYKFSGQLSIE